MKLKTAMLLACTTMGLIVNGSQYFHPGNGLSYGYWDDPNSWWSNTAYTSPTTPSTDTHLFDPVTVMVTNTVSRLWSFNIGSPINKEGMATLQVCSMGTNGFNDHIWVAYKENTKAVVDIRPGGYSEFNGLSVGYKGYGILTNSGVFRAGSVPTVGNEAGSTGVWVQAGGRLSWQYGKNFIVGKDGYGELIVNHASGQDWHFLTTKYGLDGALLVGCGSGTGHGRVIVNDGANASVGNIYLGGQYSNSGFGEIILRGGRLYSVRSSQQALTNDTVWIGAATNASGAVRTDSVGIIRGWGKIDCDTGVNKGICAVVGNGAIVADGEGEERILDCSAIWRVTNVLFCAEADRTNGWDAVNKGAVVLPNVNGAYYHNNGDHWNCHNMTNSVGCKQSLEKPDLINAVRIWASRSWMAKSYCVCAMYLAGDRSDAHADALPGNYSPIGFWKAGTFDGRGYSASIRWNFNAASIDFRYDHRKIWRPGNGLAVFRWNETEGRWDRIARYAEQPADSVVSSGKLTTTSADPAWSLGLFCVAEHLVQGTTIILR